MAYTIQLTDLTTNYDLLDKTNYKALMGMLIDPVEARVRLHVPDSGEDRVIDIDDNSRVAVLPIHALGTGDTALNSLINIKRWVDGANSQAVRYELLGDVKPIYLRVQRNGATNATIHRVKWGRVDDSFGPYTQTAHISGPVFANVTLVLAPYGELETAITLRNELENGDFTLDDGAGIAAEWAEIGTPTTTLDTTIYLINGSSQKTVSDAAGDSGIQSDLANDIGFTAGNAINGFVWVYRSAGADDITVDIIDNTGAAVGSAAKYNTAGWATFTDPRGQTWKRITVSGTTANSGETGCRLRIYRATGDASEATTFYADGAYLDVSNNTAAIPTAGWVSYALQDSNRGDQAAADPAPQYITHIDTWGIPGDAPALQVIKGSVSGDNVKTIIIGRMVDGVYAAVDQDYWIEAAESDAEVATGATPGAWSDGTGTTNNNYSIFTEGAVGTGGYIEWDITGATARQLMATPRRVYAKVRGLDVSEFTLQMSGRIDGINFVDYTSPVSLVTDATWEAADMGVLNLASVLPESPPSAASPTFSLRITISDGMAQNDTFWLDALLLVPIEDEFIIQQVQTGSATTAADEVWFDGVNKGVIMQARGIFEPAAIGTMWYIEPGPLTNRMVILSLLTDKEWVLSGGSYRWIGITVTPRTRHLLGTI